MKERIQYLIDTLGLQRHPEGGYYTETFRSQDILDKDSLPVEYQGDRNVSTSIYFLLTSNSYSAFHRVHQDEIWHFYEGVPVTIHVISESGNYQKFKVGNVDGPTQFPQLVVPGNHWFAAEITQENNYALVGCTVAPGFEFEDFELAEKAVLSDRYPAHRDIIERLSS